MNELWQRTAGAIAAAIAAREVSAAEVVDAHLARIDAIQPTVNALATRLDDAARDAARVADLAVARGEDLGPLHGVPVTVKTTLDLAGSPTTSGLRGGRERLPRVTGPEAAGLLAAGAIVVGRGNAPEFALRLHTDNDEHGPTRNPWDAGRTPGGSGGGEAVAVATGMAALGIGGDVGGSLRLPASLNGIAALKSTPGRVPSASEFDPGGPTLALQLMTAFGPFARTVADVALGFRALLRADDRDPWTLPTGADDGARPAAANGATTFARLHAADVAPAQRAAVDAAADALTAAGWTEDEPPALHPTVTDVWARLFLTDVNADWATVEPALSAGTRRWLRDAFAVRPPVETAQELIAAFRERHRLTVAWTASAPAIVLTPVLTGPPPPVDFDQRGPDALAEVFYDARFVFAPNLMGLPAAVVRVAVADDLPVAVQLVGARFAEATCLRAAALVEAAAGTPAPIDPRG